MIERYNTPEMSDIWSDHNKFKTFLDVEIALVEALEGNHIPTGTAETIKAKAKVDPKRIEEIEKETRHDVIAFCQSITEKLPDDVSKYFHFGCTSSDIIDTATTLQIKKSVELTQKQLKKLKIALLNQAENCKHIICMGRSHGMNAEPMSFGTKFLSFYAEVSRRLEEIDEYLETQITGQLSGAVGNYTILTPEVESAALDKLGLKTEPVSSQVIPRDRILKIISINAMIASTIERIVVEFRHLHHSDIGEIKEGFSKGQKGSSTMPHKKNPISSENLSGLARVIRSHLSIAHENNALWHERDISHSSAERIMLPDNFGLVFYSLRRLTSTIENLVIDTDAIQKKVFKGFTYLSSYILHKLIDENNESREKLYKLVQEATFQAKDISEAQKILSSSSLSKNTDFNFLNSFDDITLKNIYLKHVDSIYERAKNRYQE